jgi:ribosomal protein L3
MTVVTAVTVVTTRSVTVVTVVTVVTAVTSLTTEIWAANTLLSKLFQVFLTLFKVCVYLSPVAFCNYFMCSLPLVCDQRKDTNQS